MRALAGADEIRRFMRAAGRAAGAPGSCYFTGGATAVLLGWRPSTIDIDIELVPEQDDLLRALPQIKDELRVNVELASPGNFVPLPAGWMERSISAGREGHLSFFHFDPYSQALAKLERGHARDLEDVQAMLGSGLVERRRLQDLFDEIEPLLYRFPAIDPRRFRARVSEAGSA